MKPGDKVVCVDDSPCKCDHPDCLGIMVVSKGSVYVIESTFECPRNGYFSLVLIGVPAAHAHLRGVNAARFRLLDEMKKEAKEVQSKSCEK